MYEGTLLAYQTCATGAASVICPMRSRRTDRICSGDARRTLSDLRPLASK